MVNVGTNSASNLSVGRGALLRKEDEALLRGTGRYTSDIAAEGALVAAFLRSDVARGRLISVDTREAAAMPGVAWAVGADRLPELGLKPFPSLGLMPGQSDRPRPVMAWPEISHVGEILAMVVAESLAQALDALTVIDALIEAEAPMIDMRAASGDDVAYEWAHGDAQAVERAFSQAAHVARVETPSQRVIVHPMECRSCLALPGEQAELWTSSQGVHKLRDMVTATLGWSRDNLRVRTADVGGAFGMKLQAYPEHSLLVLAARKLGRRVRWDGTRTEASLMDAHGRGQWLGAELALDGEGQFTGLRVRNIADIGAYVTGFGAFTPSVSGTKVLGHSYAIPAIAVKIRAVHTNTSPIDAYRGAGKPEMVYVLERVIDEAARLCGIDRVELRRRNLIASDALPHTMPMGQKIDSGDFAGMLREVTERIDWAGFPARRQAAGSRGRLAGIGIAMHMHASGGFTNERSVVRALADGTAEGGRIEVLTGAQTGGQGHATMLAQIAAEVLELPVERVDVVQGDSGLLPDGGGTGGSSTVTIAGTNIRRASLGLIERAKAMAAARLEVAEADLVYDEGAVRVVGTDRSVTLFELAAEADGGLDFGCDYQGDNATFPNGCYAVEVEIDPETGALDLVSMVGLDDIGRVINPVIAMGQIEGGLVQGLGQAVLEGAHYDENGQLLNATLMDYTLPRADDFPAFTGGFRPTLAKNNPLGAKGAGELSIAGAMAPVVNAAIDALAPYGVTALDMPLSRERLWRAAAGYREHV